jgi:nitroreductase
MDAIDLLLARASNGKLGEPAPDDETLQLALRAALRAPDHGLLRPFHITLVRGAARERLGGVLRDALLRRDPNAPAEALAKELGKPLRAPLILVVWARVQEHPKTPAIEQILSAGAAAHGVLLALQARGYAGFWRTGPAAYDAGVKSALGLRAQDAIVGFIYAGTPRQPVPPIERPTLEAHVHEWSGPASD